jgi:hypothetical protein
MWDGQWVLPVHHFKEKEIIDHELVPRTMFDSSRDYPYLPARISPRELLMNNLPAEWHLFQFLTAE